MKNTTKTKIPKKAKILAVIYALVFLPPLVIVAFMEVRIVGILILIYFLFAVPILVIVVAIRKLQQQKRFPKNEQNIIIKEELHTGGEISYNFVKEVTNETNSALQKGFSKGITHHVPPALTKKLKNNIHKFSGFDTYKSLKQVSSLLVDEKGHIKPYYKFEQEVLKLNSSYNRDHLEVEYNYAVASAQMATKWAEYEADGDEYNLQYLTANDSNVRDEHAAMEGITLPPSDPFWKSYFPPNGWGCRCTVVQVLKDKYPLSDPQEAMEAGNKATSKPNQKTFRFNPGIEKNIYPDGHLYYKTSKKVSEEINNAVMASKS